MVSAGRALTAVHGRAARVRRRGPVHAGCVAFFMALVGLSLLAGVAGGLWRLGIALPDVSHSGWIGRVAPIHAAMMICGFLGTVIGIERAVAIKHQAAWLAPLASGTAALCLLLGHQAAGAWLGAGA